MNVEEFLKDIELLNYEDQAKRLMSAIDEYDKETEKLHLETSEFSEIQSNLTPKQWKVFKYGYKALTQIREYERDGLVDKLCEVTNQDMIRMILKRLDEIEAKLMEISLNKNSI